MTDVSFLSCQASEYLFISIQLYFSAAAQRKEDKVLI